MSAPVMVLAPLGPGRDAAAAAQAAVDALPAGAGSPFARLGATHVARFAVLPGLGVLLAADADVPAAAWLERVRTRMGAEAAAVLGHCAGFPGVDDPAAWAAWCAARRVRPGFSVRPYPGATVEEVREALDLRRRLVAFAGRAARLSPAELHARFAATFPAAP